MPVSFKPLFIREGFQRNNSPVARRLTDNRASDSTGKKPLRSRFLFPRLIHNAIPMAAGDWSNKKKKGSNNKKSSNKNNTVVRVVGEKFKDQGDILSSGTPVVSIYDLDIMISVIHVTEKDYTRINPGQAVSIFTDAFPDKEFTGSISRIAPILNESSRKPGMFTRCEIILDSHENAFCLPENALVKRDGKTGVFICKTGEDKNITALFMPVKTGITTSNLVEITAPVIKSPVITLGNHLLNNGTAVIINQMEGQGSQKKKNEKTEKKIKEKTGPLKKGGK